MEYDFVYNNSVNTVMNPHQQVFVIYSKDKTKKLGTLVCHKSELSLRPNYGGSVLAIDFLEVKERNCGYGTKILKFAEDYSKKIGCNGYMTLKSDVSYTPEKIPHIFYRKFGFSAFDKKADKKMDNFIRMGQNATKKDFPSMLMHYPPEQEKISKLKKFIQNRILKFMPFRTYLRI